MYAKLRDELVALETQVAPHKENVVGEKHISHDAVVKQLNSKDDIVKVAGTLPLCSDGVFPLLVADDDALLQQLTTALLREQVESVRVLLPAHTASHPTSTSTPTTLYCRCELQRGGTVLVLLRAANLLIPSQSVMSALFNETSALHLINASPPLQTEAALRSFSDVSPVTQHSNFAILLGFDRIVSFVIVKDHVEHAFDGFVCNRHSPSARVLCQRAPCDDQRDIYSLGACEFTAGSNHLSSVLPWTAIEHRFISLRVFEDEFVNDGMSSRKHEAVKEEPKLWGWLYLLSQHSKVASAADVARELDGNEVLWSVWNKAARMMM